MSGCGLDFHWLKIGSSELFLRIHENEFFDSIKEGYFLTS